MIVNHNNSIILITQIVFPKIFQSKHLIYFYNELKRKQHNSKKKMKKTLQKSSIMTICVFRGDLGQTKKNLQHNSTPNIHKLQIEVFPNFKRKVVVNSPVP